MNLPEKAVPRRLPLAVNLAGLPCLVVGGGKIGTRKALILGRAGARVTVVSPEISDRLRQVVKLGKIEWRQAEYDDSQLEGFILVVAATSSPELNFHIGQAAVAQRILPCVVSSARLTRIAFPAVFANQDVVVSVHSNGQNYRLSQRVRDRIAALLSTGENE
jgi:siroheme synthase-like protein